MNINFLVLPKPIDVKIARIYLDWSQEELAKRCGVHLYAINSIETGRHDPKKETLGKIAEVFLEEGIKFHPEGGFKIEKDVVKIYDGGEGYLRVVENVMETCAINKDEFLLLGADDRRSSDKVNELYKKMYKIGIPFKQLIASDNNYILGPLEDYRQVSKELFFSNDVVVIYKTSIMFFIQKEGSSNTEYSDNVKNIVINDTELAETFRKYFYRLWNNSVKPTKSSVKQILKK